MIYITEMDDLEMLKNFRETYRIVSNGLKFKVQKQKEVPYLHFFKRYWWIDIIYSCNGYSLYTHSRTVFNTIEEAKDAIESCVRQDLKEFKLIEIEKLPWEVVNL